MRGARADPVIHLSNNVVERAPGHDTAPGAIRGSGPVRVAVEGPRLCRGVRSTRIAHPRVVLPLSNEHMDSVDLRPCPAFTLRELSELC